jgi:MoxR-like ATPase
MNPTPLSDTDTQVATFRDCHAHLRTELGRVFVGQPELVDFVIVCLLCQGHALLEGAPGLGKTLLIRTLADAVSLRYARVQCTPDLMPADVTGTNILSETAGRREFAFQPGPIFANIVLADEINRATPRTQSAFLEAMQEGHVTVFGHTHRIDPPFSVFATQNPIDMEGTYPLPEAQLDRFFFKLTVRTPTVEELAEILARTTGVEHPVATARYGADVLHAMAGLIRQVKVADEVTRLVLRLVTATHPGGAGAPPEVTQYVRYGSSPRGAQAIILAAKALALIAGRYHVAPEDIRRVAVPALAHRLILNFQGEMDRVESTALVHQVLEATAG